MFDHTLDPPWSMTKVVLQKNSGTRLFLVPHDTPDSLRLGAGGALLATGVALLVVGGAGVGPLAVVVGAASGTAGGFLALTGFHPAPDNDTTGALEAWCQSD